MSGEWCFSPSEVQIGDKVLGRGAFGEVRVGRWRNIDVACKMLHALDQEPLSNNADPVHSQEIRQEIDMLSKLRHPNLVMFLGVCGDIAGGNAVIITELMPCSLYDLLEHKKIALALSDILDICFDIANGLNYLHMHSPSIVHRDISSKNILIGGGKAKIADLGQAKLFGQSTLSRQTGLPGAMAYAAPEVLTGKYSARIDIFSFGVLMCQMCCGEYPRIERREEQVAAATARQPPLKVLLCAMVNFNPAERPDSGIVCESLQAIRNNDRFYPVQQKIDTFERDMSVLARHWARELVESRSGEINRELDQTSRRLAAVEARWQAEADKVDGLTRDAQEALARATEARAETERAKLDGSQQAEQLRAIRLENEELHAQTSYLGSELQRLQSIIEARDRQLLDATAALDQTRVSLATMQEDGSSATRQLESSRQVENDLLRKNQQLHLQLSSQVEHSRDMEARLEQALVRWKQEQQLRASESARCSRLAAQNGQLVGEVARSKAEIDKYEGRLQQYDDLPLPDEIKLRFQDLQGDIKQCHDDMASVEQQKQLVQEELLTAQEKVQEYETVNTQLNVDIDVANQARREASEALDEKEQLIYALTKDLHTQEARAMDLTVENRRLLENDSTLSKVVSDLQASLSKEKQAVAQLQKTLNGGISMPSSPSRPSTATARPPSTSCPPDVVGESPQEGPLLGATDAAGAPPQTSALATTGGLADIKNDGSDTTAHSLRMRIADFEERAKVRQRVMSEALADRKPELTVKLEVQSTSSAEGATMALAQLLRTGTDDERLVWRTSRALREAVLKDSEGEDAAAAAAAAGAVRAALCAHKFEVLLLQCMNRYMDLAVVQCHCIRLLGTLAFGSDLFRRRAGEKDALSTVVTGMHMHLDDEAVQLHGCTAITNFTHNSLENRARFIEASGIEILLQSLRRHADNAKLQRQGCWALLTISGSDEAAQSVVQLHGEAVVLSAITRHGMDPGVQQFGFWALRNLAVCSENIVKLIKKQGVVELCRVAIETHRDDAEVLKQARHLLGVLSPLAAQNAAAVIAPPQLANSPYGASTLGNSATATANTTAVGMGSALDNIGTLRQSSSGGHLPVTYAAAGSKAKPSKMRTALTNATAAGAASIALHR